MKWTSILAIYTLFWVLSAFFVMPYHVRTTHEVRGELVPGQAESAPANFRPMRIIVTTTIIATLLFGLYFANYVKGWVTADMLNFAPLQRN